MFDKFKINQNIFTPQIIWFFLISIILILFTGFLVINTKIGLLILIGTILFLITLKKPEFMYFFLISLFSVDGLGLPGASYTKIIGILLTVGLFMRFAITKEKIPQDNSYKYYYLFFLGGLVSFAFAKNVSLSLQTYITYILLFIIYVITRYFLRNIEDINKAFNYLIFSCVLSAAFIRYMGFSEHSVGVERFSAGIGDSNEFASYILVLIPFALYRAVGSSGFSKILYLGCLASLLLLLIFSGSRGGMLGFLGATGVFIYYCSAGKMRQMLIFIIILAVISYFFIPDDYWTRASTIIHPEEEKGGSISTRLDNYTAAIKMFLDYPLAGVGLHNFLVYSRNYGATGGLVVHNTYLEILTGGGLLSFIPFCLILINCWNKLKLKKHYDEDIRGLLIILKASFVSILITSFFISADYKKILWFLFALIASAYYIDREYKSNNNKNFINTG